MRPHRQASERATVRQDPRLLSSDSNQYNRSATILDVSHDSSCDLPRSNNALDRTTQIRASTAAFITRTTLVPTETLFAPCPDDTQRDPSTERLSPPAASSSSSSTASPLHSSSIQPAPASSTPLIPVSPSSVAVSSSSPPPPSTPSSASVSQSITTVRSLSTSLAVSSSTRENGSVLLLTRTAISTTFSTSTAAGAAAKPDSTASTNKNIAQTDSTKSADLTSHTGTIIGASLGGFVGLMVLIVLARWVYRAYANRSDDDDDASLFDFAPAQKINKRASRHGWTEFEDEVEAKEDRHSPRFTDAGAASTGVAGVMERSRAQQYELYALAETAQRSPVGGSYPLNRFQDNMSWSGQPPSSQYASTEYGSAIPYAPTDRSSDSHVVNPFYQANLAPPVPEMPTRNVRFVPSKASSPSGMGSPLPQTNTGSLGDLHVVNRGLPSPMAPPGSSNVEDAYGAIERR